MFHDIFIRGGMANGWYYHRDGVLVSPAQVNAYKLESRKACNPIIVLSNDLAEYFTNPDNYYAYSYNPTVSLLVNDRARKIWYVDYLGAGIENLEWQANQNIVKKYRSTPIDNRSDVITEGWKINANKAFRRHKHIVLNAYKKSKVKRVKKKYKWLARYHNSVVKRYAHHFVKHKISAEELS